MSATHSQPPLPGDIALPERWLRIGVTGPTDIDADQVRPRLRALFERFEQAGGGRKLALISCLAAGADQVAARAALGCPDNIVWAVLPGSLEAYRAGQAPAARAELDEILAHPQTRVRYELGLPLPADEADHQAATSQRRQDAYSHANTVMLSNADVLVALLRCGEPGSRAGSAATAARALAAGLPLIVLNTEDEHDAGRWQKGLRPEELYRLLRQRGPCWEGQGVGATRAPQEWLPELLEYLEGAPA